MVKTTIKEKILQRLIEAPKTTADLAKELGFFWQRKKCPQKKVPEYDMVYKELKALESKGYIKGEKKKRSTASGNIPTEYQIVVDISSLVKMVKEYNSLVNELQKNDDVLNALVERHKLMLNENTLTIMLNILGPSIDQNMLQEIGNLYEGNRQRFTEEGLAHDFKNKLRTSLSFFNYCLENSTSHIMEVGGLLAKKKLSLGVSKYLLGEKIRSKLFLPSGIFVFDIIYESCVDADILKANPSKEAVEYLICRNSLAGFFCDETVRDMERFFGKCHRQLGIREERLEDCSKEEIIMLFYFLSYRDKQLKENNKSLCLLSVEEQAHIFSQNLKEGKLEDTSYRKKEITYLLNFM